MGASFLKNIMGVASTMNRKVVDKEREQSYQSSPVEHRANKTSSQWIKAHQKKSQAKKITVKCSLLQLIRVYNGTELVQKLRGFRNTSSQILAQFSANGRYIISTSEDSQVYMTISGSLKIQEMKEVGKAEVGLHEHFPCKDVSAAIAWPGSIKIEPPIVDVNSKRQSKHSSTTQPHSTSGSPTQEYNMTGESSKRHLLPTLPKKNDVLEKSSGYTEEDFAQSARIDSENGISESFGSSSSSIRYGDAPSISASGTAGSKSWSSSWSLFDGGSSQGGQTVQATAWGLAIITANVGGQIRVHQNFGLPLKVSRQTNLFLS